MIYRASVIVTWFDGFVGVFIKAHKHNVKFMKGILSVLVEIYDGCILETDKIKIENT